MRPSKSSKTACQFVGEGLPERFADGATSGIPQAFKNSSANSFRGIRTPIVSRLAVAANETLSDFGKTNVKGAGKNALINLPAVSLISETSNFISSRFPTCAIKGLSFGRFLAAKIFAIACALKTLAPRP